jgi:hypothetical protein
MPDAASGSGDHCNLSFNRLHIEATAGRHLKGASSVVIETRFITGSRHNRIHKLILHFTSLLSLFFCICVIFFAAALRAFDKKGTTAED